MNKKLLAVAVSAALVVPAASMAADAFVYGHAQVEVASYSEDIPSGLTPAEEAALGAEDGVDTQDQSRGRLGVKASEDLGNGLKAIAQFEWKVDTTQGGAAAGNRVSQVGLTGGFGTFVMGSLKSPYKYTGGVKYDPFVATSLQARGNGGMTSGALGHNSFVNDLIAYASPKGPVTASIGYGPSEDDGLVVFDLKYSQGGMEAFVAYLDAGDRISGGAPGDDSAYTATKVGGQWKSGSHKISAQYEMTEAKDAGGAKVEPTVLFLGYQMKMGKNTFALQYGDTDPDTSADNTTYVALGVIHKMSKTTRVFAGYRDTSDVENVVTVGLRKDFKS